MRRLRTVFGKDRAAIEQINYYWLWLVNCHSAGKIMLRRILRGVADVFEEDHKNYYSLTNEKVFYERKNKKILV